jgi:hypothetical protein
MRTSKRFNSKQKSDRYAKRILRLRSQGPQIFTRKAILYRERNGYPCLGACAQR